MSKTVSKNSHLSSQKKPSFERLLSHLSKRESVGIEELNTLVSQYEEKRYQCNYETHKHMSELISSSLQNGQRVQNKHDYLFLTRMLHLVSSDFIFPSYEEIIGHIGQGNITPDGLLFSYENDRELLKISQISQ